MRLHINIDHIATIRQARRTDEPDPVRAAVLAELGGADGITVHLREDRRHIQDRDVRLLAGTVRTVVNLELAATDAMVAFACELVPFVATLVPERREEVTTEGGLDLDGDAARDRVRTAIDRLRDAGVRTSLFVDPDPGPLEAAAALGADAVELHTGEYALAFRPGQVAGEDTPGRGHPDGDALGEQLARLRRAASRATALGLAVHAGHGLTYENVAGVAAIREIEELNIGHSVISRSLFVGLERAVHEMAETVRRARR